MSQKQRTEDPTISDLLDVDMVPSEAANNSYQFSCPLCDQCAKTKGDLYTHMQVRHNKSELCAELLDL